jgi:hypothetical protein
MRSIFLLFLFFRNNGGNLSSLKTIYLSKRNKNTFKYYLEPYKLPKITFNETIYKPFLFYSRFLKR